MLLEWIRTKLVTVPLHLVNPEEAADSGWDDVWIQATCFYWRVWIGPARVRLAWYRACRLHGLEQGTLRELLEHVFTPRAWNRSLSIWRYPRRCRGGRGLIRRTERGWWVVG